MNITKKKKKKKKKILKKKKKKKKKRTIDICNDSRINLTKSNII